MKILSFAQLLNLLCLLSISCSPTEPPDEKDNIVPGRRDYEWSVDTLTAPDLFYVWSIWGTDTNDVWLAGQGGLPHNLWHFDGRKWAPYQQRMGTTISIFGFVNNDIWATGGDCVYHFNGAAWSEQCFDLPGNPSNSPDVGLNSIWGNSSNNIFAVGGEFSSLSGFPEIGLIFHYNGSEWELIPLPDEKVTFISLMIDRQTQYCYLSGVQLSSSNPDINKLFLFNGKQLTLLYSGQDVASVNEINGKVYLVIGNKIYKYIRNNLELWKDFSQTNYLGLLWGRSEKDFFGISSDGLAHFDGTDMITIYKTDSFINDVFVMEKDVFMLCENRIIIHGKLMEQ